MTLYRIQHSMDIEGPDARTASEVYWRNVLGQPTDPEPNAPCVIYAKPVPSVSQTLPAQARKGRHLDLAMDPEAEIVDLAERLRSHRRVEATDRDFVSDVVNGAANMVLGALDRPDDDTRALVDLLVNAAMTLVDDPEAGIDQVVERNYEDTAGPDAVLGRS